MSATIAVGDGTAWPSTEILPRLVWRLFLVGLFSIAAVQSCQLERRECGPFTIGQSAIGSCDFIGG
jgi:hypothetical protein